MRGIEKAYAEHEKSPHDTSATVWVPRWTDHEYLDTPALGNFELVYTFEKGEKVFTKPGAGGVRVPMGGVPWAVDVYHLPEATMVYVELTKALQLHQDWGHASAARILGSGIWPMA